MRIIGYRVAEKQRNGVVSYAKAQSQTDGRKRYDVVRYRGRKYVCSCPGFTFRQKPCIHIAKFKNHERRNIERKLLQHKNSVRVYRKALKGVK